MVNKDTLLRMIAEKGYAISYAANLNFATYDIATGLPPKVSYISMAIAIIGLIWQELNSCWITVPIVLMSIACIYTEKYAKKASKYAERGKKNTEQWNRLKTLYSTVKDSTNGSEHPEIEAELFEIEKEFNSNAEYDQVLFANWYAHYKLFWEKDYHWMDEQLKFGLWKDKIPQSSKAVLIASLIIGCIAFCTKCQCIADWFVEFFSFCNC